MSSMAKSAQGKSATALQDAWKLYEGGDKLSARKQAERVLAADPKGPASDEARELIERTEPPKIFRTLAIVAATLILLAVLVALLRS